MKLNRGDHVRLSNEKNEPFADQRSRRASAFQAAGFDGIGKNRATPPALN
jgi:hypothetical protein